MLFAAIGEADVAPWIVFAVSVSMLFASTVEQHARYTLLPMVLVAALLAVGVSAADGMLGYATLGLVAFVHAATAVRHSRIGAISLVLAGISTAVAAMAVGSDHVVLAFWASLVAIALRAGVMPLHFGVVHLGDKVAALQAQQFASTLALVFLHLRFVDHHPTAYELAPILVRIGAVATLLPALAALVQRDLRGLYRCTVAMHGGMLLALLVSVTTCLGVCGFGLMVSALEQRAGRVSLEGLGGRFRAFPRLGAAFAFFGACGVGMPGTAGFIADDLFLHALWEESVLGTVLVVLGSALLAVATIRGYTRVFLGPPCASPAPDLLLGERLVAALLAILLVLLGVVPNLILGPAAALLGS